MADLHIFTNYENQTFWKAAPEWCHIRHAGYFKQDQKLENAGDKKMYENGQILTDDLQFRDHIEHEVPIQVYHLKKHTDIGFVQQVTPLFIEINHTFYSRSRYTFISRPGY